MPNNYTNILICLPGHEFDTDDWNDKHKESNLCAIVIPIPEPLEEICVRLHTGEKLQHVEAGPAKEKELIEQYGFADWRSWEIEHWGVKWGTSCNEAFRLEGGDCTPVVISFITSWTSPNDRCKLLIMDWLKRTCGFETIKWVGCDPTDYSIS